MYLSLSTMQVETKCGCLVTVTPYIPYFQTRFFHHPCTDKVELCNEHKQALLQETRLVLTQMYSDRLAEVEEYLGLNIKPDNKKEETITG